MRILIPVAAAVTFGVAALVSTPSAGAERAALVPAPKMVLPASGNREVAYFAGGCFWGVEGVFERVNGVESAVSGYAGGTKAQGDYETVSSGRTRHAETVRVVFNPRQVRYADLLQIYFSVVADPTQLNRQGPDTGPQYRSSFFPTSAAQTKQARAYIAQLSAAHAFGKPIVTKIEPFTGFVAAEAYHQDFMRKNPAHPYIMVNDRPKVVALRKLFPQMSHS
nr:peptide-methionine (S)-S-oxide reductase MsrA [Sphingomonas sp.]